MKLEMKGGWRKGEKGEKGRRGVVCALPETEVWLRNCNNYNM